MQNLCSFALRLHALSVLLAVSSRCFGADSIVLESFLEKYCVSCHSGADAEAGLKLDQKALEGESAEKVLRRLKSRQMPPPEVERPSEKDYIGVSKWLSSQLQSRAEKTPHIGYVPSIRRMTRYEYQNAIRDLLHVEIKAQDFLPADQSSHGFDNITVSDLSPALLGRYVDAAQVIARVAMGGKQKSPGGITIRIPPDQTQSEHVPGLPLGTRGGGVVHHTFAVSGEYEVQVRLSRDRDEHIEGLKEPHDLDFLLNNKRVHRIRIEPPKNNDHTNVDKSLVARMTIPAGTHDIGVTFPVNGMSLSEIRRKPFDASFNRHRHPRRELAVFEISIAGPYQPSQAENTASRRAIYQTDNASAAGVEKLSRDEAAAHRILSNLASRAYRRPIQEEDLEVPLTFFRSAQQAERSDSFEVGIELAISSILANPNFFLRTEQHPVTESPSPFHVLQDHEIASRLSFFLWSSLPDEQLAKLANQSKLQDEDVIRQEVHRMLSDGKSKSLVESFADQWLYLRNLNSIQPDLRSFPDFDDNLRQSLREETERLFETIQRENRSVIDFLGTDFTYLNERLAKHYGIPNVAGSHFRKVLLTPELHRGGLLRHGSILTVTSYATRTSPTIRGSWILKNLVGTPPPPPPANIPALAEKQASTAKTVRERLAEHRASPTCASCHNLMDPLGFALERYDAVGRWRNFEDEQPIDSSGTMPDGTQVRTIDDLEKSLLNRPELFAQVFTERLMTYALGRGVDWRDGPEIRAIVEFASKDDYRFERIVQGIVLSKPFRMRTSP